MGIKIKHYARPVDVNIKTYLDCFILELVASTVCAGAAYQGIKTGVLMLVISGSIVSLMCLFLVIFDVYFYISHIADS